ncbi:hypothetical protein QBC42DRAFT_286257 [Cladorrhinum samala]|uniref:Uncharacterized protein n=1 Tax=Cladorrhinum samala TaxID=585594 RepID=A0AAV9HRG8_9PEZI|nr:hypothetical protein QBC42DRAFT_286257 [Cladorrhinum samala]
MLSRMLLGVYYPLFALLFALTTRAATVKDNDRLENGGKPPRFAPWLNENTYPNADNETMCNVIVQLPTTDTRAWQDFAIFIYIMSYDYTDMFQIENAPWGAVVEFWISDPRNLPPIEIWRWNNTGTVIEEPGHRWGGIMHWTVRSPWHNATTVGVVDIVQTAILCR